MALHKMNFVVYEVAVSDAYHKSISARKSMQDGWIEGCALALVVRTWKAERMPMSEKIA